MEERKRMEGEIYKERIRKRWIDKRNMKRDIQKRMWLKKELKKVEK